MAYQLFEVISGQTLLIHRHGAFNKFPEFFVQAFKIVAGGEFQKCNLDVRTLKKNDISLSYKQLNDHTVLFQTIQFCIICLHPV